MAAMDGGTFPIYITTPNAKCIAPPTQHCPAPSRRRLPRSMLILVSGRWAPIVYAKDMHRKLAPTQCWLEARDRPPMAVMTELCDDDDDDDDDGDHHDCGGWILFAFGPHDGRDPYSAS